MQKRLFILLVLVFEASMMFAQIPIEWIQKIQEYRQFEMLNNRNATLELRYLFEKWDSIGVSERDLSRLTFNVDAAISLEDFGLKRVRKIIKKLYPKFPADTFFTEKEYEIIGKNSGLLNLIHIGILKNKYPFGIDPNSKLFRELEFYDIQPSDTIGEIGAGNGCFSLIVNRLFPQSNLYVNELGSSKLKYIQYQMLRAFSLFNLENIHLVRGRRKSVEIPMGILDKVIIRNTFHHFTKKEAMLNSIKASMKPDGIMFINETTLDIVVSKEDVCSKAMDSKEIERIVSQNGFELVDKIEIEQDVIFKYKLN